MSAIADRLLLEQLYFQLMQVVTTANAIVASNQLPAAAITEVGNVATSATTAANKARKAAQRQLIVELQAIESADSTAVTDAQTVLAGLP